MLRPDAQAESGVSTDHRQLRAYFDALQADLVGRLGRVVRDSTVLDEGPAPHRVEPHHGCGSRPPTGFRAAQRVELPVGADADEAEEEEEEEGQR